MPNPLPLELINAERYRQIHGEGWSESHDDKHTKGELIAAAVCYYAHAVANYPPRYKSSGLPPLGWPWDVKWWKPQSADRDFVRAGALEMAERDRLHRADPKAYIGHCDRLLDQVVWQMLAV